MMPIPASMSTLCSFKGETPHRNTPAGYKARRAIAAAGGA
jgi:hypothetical protein